MSGEVQIRLDGEAIRRQGHIDVADLVLGLPGANVGDPDDPGAALGRQNREPGRMGEYEVIAAIRDMNWRMPGVLSCLLT